MLKFNIKFFLSLFIIFADTFYISNAKFLGTSKVMYFKHIYIYNYV